MSYVCDCCEFSAPTNSRLKKHLLTQKHARNLLLHEEIEENVQEELDENVSDQEMEENVQEELEENVSDQEMEETIQEEMEENVLHEEMDETIQESISSQDIQEEFIENVQESGSDLDEEVTKNGYHITYDDDLQSINPIFLDMDTFRFLQNVKNVINSNPYIIYIIGLLFTLYSSVDEFLYPKDDTIEYIDCTLQQD